MTPEATKNSLQIYKAGDLEVAPAEFLITRAGELLKLTPLAFNVLVHLLENRGRVVTKQELFDEVWRDSFVSDNALTRVVKEIRHAIGDDAASPRYIETVPKRGYKFIAEVTAGEPSVTPVPAIPRPVESNGLPASPGPVIPPPQKRFAGAVVLASFAAVLLISGLIAAWYVSTKNSAAKIAVANSTQITTWTGLDNYPAVAPDGNSIAYSSDRDGGFDIYVRPLAAGAREIRVTADGGQNVQPAWSPDGQSIAFHSRSRGGIWVVPATGGTPRLVVEFGSRPAWSRDGKTIAFQSGALTDLGPTQRTIPPSVLWTVPAAGGPPRQITWPGQPLGGHGSPAWSPDGRWIAFNVEDVTTFAVWLLDTGSGMTKEIGPGGSDAVFEPGGRGVLYASLNGVRRVELDAAGNAAEPAQVQAPTAGYIRHLSISTDGKRLAYTMFRSESNIWSLTLDPRTSLPADEGSPVFRNTSMRNTFPSFSPDGERLAFVSYVPGAMRTVVLSDPDGSDQTQTTFRGIFPHWLADGRRLGSVIGTGAGYSFNIFDPATGREEAVLKMDEGDFVRLSPDGREVAYNAKRDGTVNVWIADLETGERRQLTFDSEMMGFPAWSPDGRWLAVQGKRGDDTHIFVIPREGGEPRQITDEPGQSWVHSVSPDGTRIAFAGQRGHVWNLYWISVSTGERKQLTNNSTLTQFVRYPAWSPKGDRIVYELSEVGGNIWLTTLQ